ncbi:hypothetical protein Leryth_020105 [Lithospermum erythrorhizon]|nr:hypothetical protein Leryth_020105 [Lithospermum erythrorhizon]
MTMSSLSRWILDPKKNPLAALHKKTIEQRLRKYGLRYDDLYDPYYDLDIKEALNRLPKEIAMQTPFRSYLKDMLALVKRERAEREALGALPLYQRSIP